MSAGSEGVARGWPVLWVDWNQTHGEDVLWTVSYEPVEVGENVLMVDPSQGCGFMLCVVVSVDPLKHGKTWHVEARRLENGIWYWSEFTRPKDVNGVYV